MFELSCGQKTGDPPHPADAAAAPPSPEGSFAADPADPDPAVDPDQAQEEEVQEDPEAATEAAEGLLAGQEADREAQVAGVHKDVDDRVHEPLAGA